MDTTEKKYVNSNNNKMAKQYYYLQTLCAKALLILVVDDRFVTENWKKGYIKDYVLAVRGRIIQDFQAFPPWVVTSTFFLIWSRVLPNW